MPSHRWRGAGCSASAAPEPQPLRRAVAELVELAEQLPALVQYRSWAAAGQYARLLDLVERHLEPAARVLDWGAGTGHFSYVLHRGGFDVTAYGFEPRLVVPGTIHYVQARDPQRLPFDDRSFAAATSVGVLEHVHETGGDVDSSLEELRRVLEPGGILLVCHLPRAASWIEAVARALPGERHTHTRLFDVSSATQLLTRHRFEVVRVDRYGLLPRNWSRRWPRRLRHSRRLGRFYGDLDGWLEGVLGRWSQNLAIVARAR
jgi:SAM-dependent methyltransferase